MAIPFFVTFKEPFNGHEPKKGPLLSSKPNKFMAQKNQNKIGNRPA